jgi:hypothetical protein
MNDDEHDIDEATEGTAHDEQRAREDELIRQYLLAQAVERVEYEGKYGFLRTGSS